MIVALSAGRDAPVELRSRLSIDPLAQEKLLMGPRPGLGELAVVSTCHRTEIYATGDGLDADVVHAVAAMMPGLLPTDHSDMRFMQGVEAVEHLFRVACGLDSLVIGEPQVLGQIRRSFVLAQKTSAAGPVLSTLFGRAIRLGRKVRAETALGRLGQSIGTIAADYVEDRFQGLAGKNAVIVGAGEAAADAARSFWKAGASICIVSRSQSSADRLAEEVGGEARGLDELGPALEAADFGLFAVSGGPLINASDLPSKPRKLPFLILDLSVPAALEPGHTDIELKTLEEIPGPRGPEVTDAVIDAEAMVKKEVADLQHWADTRESGPAIQQLRTGAEAMVKKEVLRTSATLELSPAQQDIVDAMAMRIVNKLLHGPTAELRRADEITRAFIKRMFHLDP